MDWKPGWLVALVVVALGAAAVVLLMPRDGLWTATGGVPTVYGAPDDPFSYDGTHALVCTGSIDLWVDARSGRGELDAILRTEDPSGVAFLASVQSGSRVSIRSEELILESVDDAVHGDTQWGGAELPETHAWIAGTGHFTIAVDGERDPETFLGRWIVAHALRREDGAVRRGGLVYSPLLRDKRGFADADRVEATLLLMRSDGTTPGVLEMLVVFRDVELTSTQRPER
jgi:hypothetical protein